MKLGERGWLIFDRVIAGLTVLSIAKLIGWLG